MIETKKDQGWSWAELDMVSAAQGGAPPAHVDALKLMAALLQHNDSKDANQRLVCDDDSWTEDQQGARFCARPILMIQDVGATFGGAGNRIRVESKVNLAHWREKRIWLDGKRCVANLVGSTKDGTLTDPPISEEGRAFLAGLLSKVSAEQIRDLFRVSQVTIHDRGTAIADWERAFWYKAWQIVNHRCPA